MDAKVTNKPIIINEERTKMNIVVGTDLHQRLVPEGICRIVLQIDGQPWLVGYEFPIQELCPKLIAEMANLSQGIKTVLKIKALAGYQNGWIASRTINLTADETVYGAFWKVVASAQQIVTLIGKDSGWRACRNAIAENPLTALYHEIVNRGAFSLQDLPSNVVGTVAALCPPTVVNKGLDAVLKYLNPAPQATHGSVGLNIA